MLPTHLPSFFFVRVPDKTAGFLQSRNARKDRTPPQVSRVAYQAEESFQSDAFGGAWDEMRERRNAILRSLILGACATTLCSSERASENDLNGNKKSLLFFTFFSILINLYDKLLCAFIMNVPTWSVRSFGISSVVSVIKKSLISLYR